MASRLPAGSVNCIWTVTGTSMTGLSSAAHITVTLDPVRPSGLIGSLMRVMETGRMTAGGGVWEIETFVKYSIFSMTMYQEI